MEVLVFSKCVAYHWHILNIHMQDAVGASMAGMSGIQIGSKKQLTRD